MQSRSEAKAPPHGRRVPAAVSRAVTGDLVLCIDGGSVSAIEVVGDHSAEEIVARWHDQMLVGATGSLIEVWEAMPGSYFRRRRRADRKTEEVGDGA